MNILFAVSEDEIAALDNHRLRPLLNKLLREEARKYGIPPHALQLTDVDNIGDEGIDARIQHNLTLPAQCRIPDGLSVWQYKAGNATKGDIRKESQKPGIQDAIRTGGVYCFITGYQYSHTMRKSRETALAEAFAAHNKPSKGVLFTAAEIADWVSDYPVIAADLLDFRMHDDLITFEQWDTLPEMRSEVEFQVNDKRQTLLDTISNILSSFDHPISIRLSEIDGIGKTRLILETIRKSGMQNLTFYAMTPDAIPEDFFNFVQSRISIDKLVLVVDECNQASFRTLWRRAKIRGKQLALVTIGSERLLDEDEIEPGLYFFNVDKLSCETILKILKLMEPHLYKPLHPELQHYIAHSVDGNVKLATAMAESLAKEQIPATTAQLIALHKMQFILQSLVSDAEDREAMQALSLLRYIGLDGEVKTEGQLLANFLGIDFAKLKTIATKMQRRGLVIKRGRFRYVTPSLLAVQFAKEVWETRTDDIVDELLPELIALNVHERLLQRLGDIGQDAFATSIVEQLFGPSSPFSNIEQLDDEQNARLLNILVNAAPNSSMRVLERIFRDVPRERLLQFKNGRRQVVDSLERLLRLRSTFFQAAKLILKLADAENEDFGNNSTGIWHDIFYTFLGRGPYPAWQRHSLINEALESETVNIRLLGVKALSAALGRQQFGTYGQGPGGQITEQWQPKTGDEVLKSHRSALKLLDKALVDPDKQVTFAAIEGFLQSARSLLSPPIRDEVMQRLERLVYADELPEKHKKTLIDVLQQMLEYDAKILPDEQQIKIRQWCEDLFGNSFHDRLHRWVGKLTWIDRNRIYRDEDKLDLSKVIAELANEGNEHPELLESELDWLTSSECEYSHTFGFALGSIDGEKKWLGPLIERAGNSQGPMLLSQYLLGKSQAGYSEWMEQLLQQWIETEQGLVQTVFITISHLGGSEKRVNWILELIDKGWLPCEWLTSLYSTWLEPLSEEVFTALLQPLLSLNAPPYTAIALDLIENWLKNHGEHSSTTARVFIALLERPQEGRNEVNRGDGWYEWQRICLFYVSAFPEEITKAAIKQMHHSVNPPFSPQDYRLLVLKEALTTAPEIAWPLIGEAILNAKGYGFDWPITALELGDRESLNTGSLFEVIDNDTLLNWIEQHEPDAPRIIAQYIQVEKIPLPELARNLIIRYGNDRRVRRSLDPRYRSTVWWGFYTERLQATLEAAKEWCKDDEKSVRDWACDIVTELEDQITKEKVHEDEQDLRWH